MATILLFKLMIVKHLCHFPESLSEKYHLRFILYIFRDTFKELI